jgi:hypothetical protein
MREYGSVHTCFWAHSEIQSLSDHAKLLALYLLTGPHTNMLGCFRLPMGYISEDLGWRLDVTIKKLEELFQIGFAHYDTTHHWIMLPQFLTWNPIENPNQGKSIRRLFEQVPKKVCFFGELINALFESDKYLEAGFKENLSCLSQSLKKSISAEEENSPASLDTPLELPIENTTSPQAVLCAEADVSVICIALNDRSEFPISQSQIDEWQLLYPAVDVVQTLRNIRAWNQANPTRRKTKSGILRHIVAWLAKEQNQPKSDYKNALVREPLNTTQARNLAIANQWLQASHYPTVTETSIHPTEENL